MKEGERIQYACGHWLTAGHYGIKDDSVKDVPNKRCGPCLRRIEHAAEDLLEALEAMQKAAPQTIDTTDGHELWEANKLADTAIKNARGATS